MTLVSTDESKEIMKKFENLWSKIRGPTRSITNNSDAYDEKYIKIKFNSVDDLFWNKTLKICNMIVVVSFFYFFFFHEDNKCLL